MPHSILRLHDVMTKTGYPRSSLYLKISNGLWPKPIKLGIRSVGWAASEVELINTARIAGKTDEQIKKLVKKIHQDRKSAFKEANHV